MAFRSWVKLLASTAMAAAVVGAGQLGIAYGLGMVRLDLDLDVTLRDQWTAQLAWVAWIAMTAAAIGAVVGTGLRPRWRPQPVGVVGALAMGLAAGFGALAVVPLTMQPARLAQIDGVRPVFVIGVCAGLAAALSIFAAWTAAAKAVARWSLATTAVLVWIVALVSVVPSLLPGHTPAAPRLGVLEGSLIPAALVKWTSFVTMPVLALLAGLILGFLARRRGKSTLAVALAGLAGPAVLTVAYLIAGPGQNGSSLSLSPYWAAMTAAGAGVLGSVLAAIMRGAPAARPVGAPAAAPVGAPAAAPVEEPGDAPEPKAAPLPQRHSPSQSAIAAVAAAAAQRPDAQLRPSDTGVLPVAADPPHPLADLTNTAPAGAVPSPFSSGTGTPFSQSAAPASGVASVPQQPGEPRFSGQQGAPDSGATAGLRRGWRARGPADENPPAPAPAFNGFAAAQQPGPRTGVGTAAPLTPDAILPPDRNRRGESEYVDWVNGLGNS